MVREANVLSSIFDRKAPTKEILEDTIGTMFEGENLNTSYDEESGKINVSTTLTKDSIEDSDGDTKIELEKNEDEDKIRIYVDGREEAMVDSDGNLDLMGDKLENSNINGGTF